MEGPLAKSELSEQVQHLNGTDYFSFFFVFSLFFSKVIWFVRKMRDFAFGFFFYLLGVKAVKQVSQISDLLTHTHTHAIYGQKYVDT